MDSEEEVAVMASWETFRTKEEWRHYLQNLLKTNDEALLKALVLIYQSQAPHEQLGGVSTEHNCVGFTSWDANELGTLAKRVQANIQLTPAELCVLRNKMPKYWKQLLAISKRQLAEREEAAKAQSFALRKQLFKEHISDLQACSMSGKMCEYGICDECPVTHGLQTRLMLEEDQ